MSCIFCDNQVTENSEEHIVPESLGNEKYILALGAICNVCNNRFSRFEKVVLAKSVLGFERARLGIKTKKGNPSKAQTGKIHVEGNKDFKKDLVTLKGLNEDSVQNVNNKDSTFQVIIPGFEKCDMAASRLILKIGYESFFQSQKEIFSSYNFLDLKNHLLNRVNNDWPFLTSKLYLSPFESIPTFNDKYLLKKIPCLLQFSKIDNECLLFNFKYGGISMFCNLINRSIKWMHPYLSNDPNAQVYPQYLKKKFSDPLS